jgi:hypothetical protein
MQVAMATATVGRANTSHIVLVEVLENGKLKTFGVNCGSRIPGTGLFVSAPITRTIDSSVEKFFNLYPEVVGKLTDSHHTICKKCWARVSD